MTAETSQLTGYVRSDGRIGFRNHTVIVPLAGCVQGIANRIAARVEGAVAFNQPLGCDLVEPDIERLGVVLYQLATHPNVGAAIFVTLGCAAGNTYKLTRRVAETGRPTHLLNFNQVGGTSASVEAGEKVAREMIDALAEQSRVPVPLSSIVLGTKCGASDKTSFEVCHPIVGAACDRLVDAGATVVLSEDFELHGALDALVARAVDEETAERLRAMDARLDAGLRARSGKGVDDYSGDPVEARVTSLAHLAKAGTRPISKVVRLGNLIDAAGLVVLDAPNSDLISITSLAAAGCNLLAFTTGRGTPAASPVVPTIKITANERTYRLINENTDVLVTGEDASSVDRLLDAIIASANGEPTKAERAGHGEMFVPLEGVTF